MFRNRLKQKNTDNIHSIICKGNYEEYTHYFKEQPQTPHISYLEYALVYGRIEILNDMVQDDFYINILKDSNYNPFDLSNCYIDVAIDVHDNSHWGNDEHERMVYNKSENEKCFNLMEEKFNKKFNSSNFDIWYSLSFYDIYNNKYFPTLNFLVSKILNLHNKELTIKNVIDIFLNTMNMTPKNLLNLINKLFKPEEIISMLKQF
jgi:hypothetical protein